MASFTNCSFADYIHAASLLYRLPAEKVKIVIAAIPTSQLCLPMCELLSTISPEHLFRSNDPFVTQCLVELKQFLFPNYGMKDTEQKKMAAPPSTLSLPVVSPTLVREPPPPQSLIPPPVPAQRTAVVVEGEEKVKKQKDEQVVVAPPPVVSSAVGPSHNTEMMVQVPVQWARETVETLNRLTAESRTYLT